MQITPLILPQLPTIRKGLTEFTFSRYLCPYLCDFVGTSVFLDADMLVLCDIWELMELWEPLYHMQIVKNEKQKFEWPSLMMFSNARCRRLTPEFINNDENKVNKIWDWADLGEFPSEYNHCVGYDAQRGDAKIVHFTQGLPCFKETIDSEYAAEWEEEMQSCLFTVGWEEIMGKSVHKKHVLARANG